MREREANNVNSEQKKFSSSFRTNVAGLSFAYLMRLLKFIVRKKKSLLFDGDEMNVEIEKHIMLVFI